MGTISFKLLPGSPEGRSEEMTSTPMNLDTARHDKDRIDRPATAGTAVIAINL